jgi:hypothetical protein
VTSVITLVRALPWVFCGRLVTAFFEIVLAALVLSTAIVMGHELRDWRTFYADANHPWSPTRAPMVSPIAEPRP